MSLITAAPASAGGERDLGLEGVGADRDVGRGGEAGDGGDQALDLVGGLDRRAGAGRDGADVDHLEAEIDQGQTVGHGLLRRAAAGPLVHRVDRDVDDPGAEHRGRARSSVRSASFQVAGAGIAQGSRKTSP